MDQQQHQPDKEQWRLIDLPPIKRQYYMVSNLGRVATLNTEGRKADLDPREFVDPKYLGREMETNYSGHSSTYSICRLTSDDGKRPYYRVDKLVLLHFMDPEFRDWFRKELVDNPNLDVVFKDGNKKNPSFDNLNWFPPKAHTPKETTTTTTTTSTTIKPHPAKGINLKKPATPIDDEIKVAKQVFDKLQAKYLSLWKQYKQEHETSLVLGREVADLTMTVKADKKANKGNGNKRIQQLSDELKASKQRLSQLQGEVKDWKAKYKEQADIVRKLEHKINSAVSGPDSVKFVQMQSDLFKARQEVESIRGKADSIAQAYNHISSDNAMLNKALKKAQQAKSTHDEDSLALIESLQNENKRLRNYKNKIHSRYEASKNDIDQLKEQVKQLVEDQKSGAKVPKTKELHTYQGVLKKDRMGQIETVYGSLNAALQDNPTVGIDELKRALNANVKLMVSGHAWQYLPYKDFDY